MERKENAFLDPALGGDLLGKSPSGEDRATALSQGARLRSLPSWALVVSVVLIAVVAFSAVQMAGSRPKKTLPPSPSGMYAQTLAQSGQAQAYRVARRLILPNPAPVAIAVGKNDQLFLACQDELIVLSPTGSVVARQTLEAPPQALAIGPPDCPFPHHVFVVSGKLIEAFTPELTKVTAWTVAVEPLQVVALAVGREHIYLVNAALGEVARLNFRGEVVGRFGGSEQDRGWPGLVLPSLRTDIVIDSQGHVFLSNPGLRRVEVYTAEGKLEHYWGGEGAAPTAFFGCCNPQHLTVLPNGNVVTSEKGLLRLKEMSPFGEFIALVAGEAELADFEQARHRKGDFGEPVVVDVAADSRGGIWALYPGHPVLLYFEPTQPAPR
ncbi:MAG: hypothetical protein NZ899_13425 [Thermoguttaceae bacterium]|nr:hypothetical protein [Thermoguttaceae bacterium]MDW8077823.1 hypothetical protein [Thermoguttaceae bacterium]